MHDFIAEVAGAALVSRLSHSTNLGGVPLGPARMIAAAGLTNVEIVPLAALWRS
jgi:hypothetical protein